MAEGRKDERAGDSSGSEREGTPAQYGDDQGTRVGSPRESGRAHDRAKGQPGQHGVPDGVEGSILDGGDDSKSAQASAVPDDRSNRRGSLGAGAESAQGVHNVPSGSGTPNKGTSNRAGEGPATGAVREGEGDVERSGSEPLRGTSQQHQSGYGGGANPKTSSDEREPQNVEDSDRGKAELGDQGHG